MKYIIILFVAFFFNSCKEESYPKYNYCIDKYVPDSLMPEVREWITETTRAANQNLSAGDYEDIYITIRQSKFTAYELFSVRAEGLWIKENSRDYGEFIPIEKMTCNERQIFEKLKLKCQ